MLLRHWKTRALIAAATLVAFSTVPAIAAEAPSPERLRVIDAVRKDLPQLAKELAARRAREREEKDNGPFVPIVGEVDYGSSDAVFGAARSGHMHEGQDMFAATGTPLVAVADTEVAETGTDAGQGNYLYLYDPERERTYVYMHMVAPAAVQPGEQVEAGDQVGAVGCTGSCYGEHLHFEIRAGEGIAGAPSDPLPELRSWEQPASPTR